MCGIGGVLFHPDDVDSPRRGLPMPRCAAILLARLAHRGPDGDGVFVDDGVVLVHTRLALVDPVGGAQPLRTPDGRFVVIVNGEIYNHNDLRPELQRRGAVFRTRSDAEVLLWTLALHGTDGLQKLEGEYAFCCWDVEARRAILGRDPLGVKPLVFAMQGGACWFASEVKALMRALPQTPALRDDVVVEALVCPALSGEAIPFAGIDNVPAGGILVVDKDGSKLIGRWRWLRSDAGVPAPADLAHALHEAVRSRLAADAAVGAFLSGGVDSSALVAAAVSSAAASAATAAPSIRLPCFTLRFEGDGAPVAGSIVVGDDAPFTELLAQQWPIDLHRVHTTQRSLVDDIDALGAAQDRLAAWEQELSQRALARCAAGHVKAVLVGDAADETHFGYAFALAPDVCSSPLHFMNRFGAQRRRRLLRADLRCHADDLEARYRVLAQDDGVPFGHGLAQDRLAMTTLLQQRWLPRLLHNGDLHTMAFGLEARVPFADRRVLQLAAAVPLALGFIDGAEVPEKSFLRRAVAPWLPAAIVARRKSALPRDERLGAHFQQRLGTLLGDEDARMRLGAFFDVSALKLLQLEADVDDSDRALLFSILAFEAFMRHHVESALGSPRHG